MLQSACTSKRRALFKHTHAHTHTHIITHTKTERETDMANPGFNKHLRSLEKTDSKSDISACVFVGWCVHCRIIIKCKTVTKEWILLKPLGFEYRDETSPPPLEDELISESNKVLVLMKTLEAPTFCLKLSINQSSTITAEYHWDLGAITYIASYYILWLSHPTKAAVSHIQTATL